MTSRASAAVQDKAPAEQLNARAKYRLRLAAALLASGGRDLKLDRARFYEQMIEVIAGLNPQAKDALRSQVDWVEAFDPNDELGAAKGRARKGC